MQEIMDVISQVGFPIACCIVMFVQNNKLQTTLGEVSTTMQVMSERLSKIESSIDNQ